ncbi:MAG: N-acetyltransferase [Bacteroidetes bacterium]|nr:MAG: N-acetyltransferase [Bacteroidota bacterium]
MTELIPIFPSAEENAELLQHPELSEVLSMTISYYDVIGFHQPWIGYLVRQNQEWVGSAAFKGAPVENKIEIAYWVFEAYEGRGIGTQICHELVSLAQATDPGLTITARTLPERNASCRILEKNGFRLLGTVYEKDDGDVWEWRYQQEP